MITKFVLNAIFYHVGMAWIICSIETMLYEIKENNHPDRFNKVPWYSTTICSKLNVKMFEDFIKHAITDRYHLMCSIIAHYKQQSLYEDEESSIRYIPNLIMKHQEH